MLQGSLENFELADVLGLLSSTRKSGRLRLTGDRGTGSLWLENGELVNGIVGVRTDASIEEMVFELMRFTAGDFSFSLDERAIQAGDPESVPDVVDRATARLQEWYEIEAVVPSLAHIVSPAAQLPADEVRITSRDWQALLASGQGTTVGAMCTALHLGEVDGSREVKYLVDRGLLVVDAPPSPSDRGETMVDHVAQDEPIPAYHEPARDEPVPAEPVYEEPVYQEPVYAEAEHAEAGHDEAQFEQLEQEPVEQFAPLAEAVIDFGNTGSSHGAPRAIDFSTPVDDEGFVFDQMPEDAGFAEPEYEDAYASGSLDLPPSGIARAGVGVPNPATVEQSTPEWTPNWGTPVPAAPTPGPMPAPPAALSGAAMPPPPPPPAPPAAVLDPIGVAEQTRAAVIDQGFATPFADDEPSADEGGGSLLMRYLKSER